MNSSPPERLRTPLWHRETRREASCAVCSAKGSFPLIFEIDSIIRPHPRLFFAKCPECGTVFQLDFTQPDYAPSKAVNPVALKFYLEQGAGLEILALPAMIAAKRASQARHHAVRTYLEVGCGFGFGIDFAMRSFGWKARGIDPSPFGQAGRRLLGIDIQPEYLTRDNATSQGKQDVIAALEVIEHIVEPHDFIDTLKFNLTDDALLIVTTPDGGAIQIDQAMPTFLSVVTPGYHAILYTRESLRRLLERAGFPEIQVVARGATLLAVAGPGAAQIDLDHAFDTDLYARYLEKKLDDLRNQPSIRSPKESGPDAAALKDRATLETGFAYRLFKHLVNQGRYPEAELALYGLADIARRRHGIEILDTAAIIALLDQDWDFESLTERIPVCLTGVLFFSAYIRLNHYEDRAGAAALFSATMIAAKRQREILQRKGYDDGEIADIEAVAARQLALVNSWMSGGS